MLFYQMVIQRTFSFECRITVRTCAKLITTCFRMFRQMFFEATAYGSFKGTARTLMYLARNGCNRVWMCP
nr:unnamed protein product [Callosobruchus analis]